MWIRKTTKIKNILFCSFRLNYVTCYLPISLTILLPDQRVYMLHILIHSVKIMAAEDLKKRLASKKEMIGSYIALILFAMLSSAYR